MKIINQSYEIVDLPNNILQTIEVCSRTCYKSEDKIGCTSLGTGCYEDAGEKCREPLCEHHSSHKFTKMLLDRGHHAMIEFGDIIVRFVTNRGVTHELVRHRLCSFAQECVTGDTLIKTGSKTKTVKKLYDQKYNGNQYAGYPMAKMVQKDKNQKRA
jgi:hypothetical protein